MNYRPFGKTGLNTSILGFGMMRMPKKADGGFDEEWSIQTLRNAIDRGLNYVDTAYVYGDSERVTGLCLQDGYREKVILASKMPVYNLTCEEEFDQILNEQLERLQTDHIDMYLLHALSKDSWDNKVLKFNLLDHMEQAKAAGKIRHIGFSFHDGLDTFKEILYGYDKWDFCQIQLNYVDVNYQAGLEGMRLAHQRGLAVVIMEPLRGGALANVPEQVADMLPKNPVESALDFLWNMKEVTVVLSGMSEVQQVEQNLSYAKKAQAGMLAQEELDAILAAGDTMRKFLSTPCTGCDYCSICPQGIAIPKIFAISNRQEIDGNYAQAKDDYLALGEQTAANCIECGACVKRCPQHINIPEQLKNIHKEYQ